MNSLKSVIEIKNGKIANKSGSKYPVFGGNGIIGYSDEFNYENIIVIGRVGANCGSVHKYEGKCWVSDNALAGLPLNNSNSFNYYLIKSFNLNKFQIGSSQPLLTQTILYNINITFPKSEIIQQKIASVLLALDDKIELNNKINAELEAMAKTLYDYWFVQFDFPNEEGKPYKSSGGKMVYNETLKREIPEGWEVENLFEVSKVQYGFPFSTDFFNDKENGVPVIRIRDILNNSISNYSTQEDIDEKYLIEKGDVLVGMDGNFHINYWSKDNCYLNQRVVMIKQTILPSIILRYQIEPYIQLREKSVSRTTVGHLSDKDLKAINLLVPSNKILEHTKAIFKSYLEKIISNKEQNQELVQLRDWLLPMLMNGQVTVEDVADKVLGMVAESSVDYQINNLTDKDKKIRRKMLATYIINQSLDDTSFGKTKFEKLLHLVECHIVKGDYNQKYSVQAAGPYDGGFTKVFWNEVTKSKWFEIKEFGKLKRIVAGENHIKSQKDYGYLSDELKELINNFISKFKNSNYERPEIVSTLFAVWNNRIIRNEMITDALLKKDFLEWDEQKARYENRLDDALAWMRNNNVIPTGWGNEIKRVKK
ncbi:restriction endonuclease subunit S [Empedobacter falsenii]